MNNENNSNPFAKIKPSGWTHQPAGPSPVVHPNTDRFGGQIRDTFGVGHDGGILPDAHTTVQIPGGQKKRLDW